MNVSSNFVPIFSSRSARAFLIPARIPASFSSSAFAQPKDAKENRGAVGEFFWDGAATTLFWIDPANDLVAVFFVQVFPFDGTLHHDFRQAVYGAEYLGPAGD